MRGLPYNRLLTGVNCRPKSLQSPPLSELKWRCPLHLCRSASGQGIQPPDVRELAKMAHITVTDEEVADWEPKLLDIVKWFDQLQAINVEGVPAAGRVDLDLSDRSRPDCPEEYPNRKELLEGVPDREGPFVKVPKIL